MGSISKPRAIRVLPPDHEVEALLSRLRPPQARLDLASELPGSLRDHIRKSKRLITRSPHTLLAGSYGRHVSTHQIKDVDIVVFVDERYRALGPVRLLEDLELAVTGFAARRAKGTIDKRRQRRSMRVTFADDDFYIDLVPALAPKGPTGTLEIPDRETGQWIKTASIRYGTAFSDLNAAADGQLLHLVLLLRHWQLERCSDVRVKGFWLEALAVHLLAAGTIHVGKRPLLDTAADTLDAMYAYCKPAHESGGVPRIPDPVLAGNVAGLWTFDEFRPFFERLAKAHDQVAKAVAATSQSQAISAWQGIFGEKYLAPTPVLVQAAKAVTAMSVGGAIAYVVLLALGRRR